MVYDNRPIGVFDSGVGGLSVLSELIKIMPNENYIYFGDSKNAPYGVKPFEEVRDLTFHTADYLVGEGCKALVIACNTATAAAVRPLRAKYPDIPVIGIEPALKPAVLSKKNGKVLVLATSVTLHEEKFHRLMTQYEQEATILTLACPGIVRFVERGIIDGSELIAHLKEIFAPFMGENTPDAVVLGCTHYPFVRAAIDHVFDGRVLIFDGGNGTARRTQALLTENELLADPAQIGELTIHNSNPDMLELSHKLLEMQRSR